MHWISVRYYEVGDTTKLIYFFITPQGLEAALLEGPELQIRDIKINKIIDTELYNIYMAWPDYLWGYTTFF